MRDPGWQPIAVNMWSRCLTQLPSMDHRVGIRSFCGGLWCKCFHPPKNFGSKGNSGKKSVSSSSGWYPITVHRVRSFSTRIVIVGFIRFEKLFQALFYHNTLTLGPILAEYIDFRCHPGEYFLSNGL